MYTLFFFSFLLILVGYLQHTVAGVKNAFSQGGQSIVYQHEFPTELVPALECLYDEMLQKINAELPELQLHPIKVSTCYCSNCTIGTASP
jgi:hypothetical protein